MYTTGPLLHLLDSFIAHVTTKCSATQMMVDVNTNFVRSIMLPELCNAQLLPQAAAGAPKPTDSAFRKPLSTRKCCALRPSLQIAILEENIAVKHWRSSANIRPRRDLCLFRLLQLLNCVHSQIGTGPVVNSLPCGGCPHVLATLEEKNAQKLWTSGTCSHKYPFAVFLQ